MSFYEYDAFTLPTIEFVGGETQTLTFNVYNKSKDPVEISGQAKFSVTPYTGATSDDPIIAKTMTISESAITHVHHILNVTLTAQDTYSLSGKYVYQITIKSGNYVEIPKQGIIYITRNNYPSYAIGQE